MCVCGLCGGVQVEAPETPTAVLPEAEEREVRRELAEEPRAAEAAAPRAAESPTEVCPPAHHPLCGFNSSFSLLVAGRHGFKANFFFKTASILSHFF